MSNYSTLKAAISAVIKENNNHEITGQVLQTTLLAMVDSLAGGYLFKGIATPATVVGTPDENVFYIGGGGVYSNFGATPVNVPDGCIGIFTYNGSFENHIIPTGGVFDISAYNAVGGTLATYANLQAALGTNGANIPDYLRKGGMSVKFIQGNAPSSDNKYVQFRCKTQSFSTNPEDWSVCDDETLVDAPDYIKAETDLNGLLLFWIKSDGSVDWAVGVPKPVKDYVDSCIAEILNGNEGSDIDGLNKVIAFLDDFSTSDTLASLLNTKIDKEEGKGLIQDEVAESLSVVEEPEFMDAELDSERRVLGGRKANGNKFENMPIETPSTTISSVDSEEEIDAELDSDGKVLSYRKKDGTKVENAGIETKSLSINEKPFEKYLEDVEGKIPGETTDVIPYNDLLSIGTKTIKIYNPYKDTKAHRYTGQMHCHSWTKFSGHSGKFPYGYTIEYTESLTPEARQQLLNQVAADFVQRHKDEGFDFMALTNYAQFGDVTHKPAVMPANFLWLCDSYETVTNTLGVTQHQVVHCAPNFAELYNSGTFAEVMDKVENYGCISQWPHPTDIPTPATPEVIATVRKRLRLMEVWDGISMRKYYENGDMLNKAVVLAGVMPDQPYDDIIKQGNFVFCMAISDERPALGREGEAMTTPNASKNIKNGCVKVFADTLTSEDIFNSLLTGNFYASSDSDVNINSVTIANGRYTVDVGIEGVVVEFLKENNIVIKTVNTSAGNTTAYYDITGDEQYVRARVHKLNELAYNPNYWYHNKEWIIWTQPVFISKSIL